MSLLSHMDTKRLSDSFEKKNTVWEMQTSPSSTSCHGGVELAGAMGSHSVQDSQLRSATHPPNAIVQVTVGVLGFSL